MRGCFFSGMHIHTHIHPYPVFLLQTKEKMLQRVLVALDVGRWISPYQGLLQSEWPLIPILDQPTFKILCITIWVLCNDRGFLEMSVSQSAAMDPFKKKGRVKIL